ncbi:universal stress protein [Ureibacillus acetophenoni]|uniref:Universal stress protein n=1 Tax=Ureibacillus acetophenoni TaxID=614649 RepID=A0A285U442_9BACL|nr:universal stress protein [Ureibacillus acetophenoni]SOC36457.1 nucleotide-binding universal stress UspA family protein [Ureibacillus acetophenoni]
MSSYSKIVVAIDFSEQSMKAFQRAIKVAMENKAILQLVHIIDTKSFGIGAYNVKFAEKVKAKSYSDLESISNEAKAAGVESVEVLVEEGAPVGILTKLTDVDLIICGATGYNSIENMMIGSVAERIVRLAKCDVLVVRS